MEDRVSKIVPFDAYNWKVGKDIIGTVVSNFDRFAWKNGWKLIELYES